MIKFRVRISTPLRKGAIQLEQLDNAVKSGTFGTDIAGGFKGATLTLYPGWRDPIPPGAHVEIFPPVGDGDKGIAYEGQRVRPTMNGRDLVSVDVMGYGTALTDCNPLQTANLKDPNEAALPAARILRIAMAQAPLLHAGEPFADPSAQRTLSTYDGRTPWDVQNSLASELGYDWMVYEERKAIWIPRTPPPGGPQYQIRTKDCNQWEPDDTTIFTRVRVTYTDVVTNTPEFVDIPPDLEQEELLGLSRGTVVSGGTISAAAAYDLGATYLAGHRNATIRASIGPFDALRGPYGGYVPGWAVRAGEWVQVGDPHEEDIRGVVQIQNTSVDWDGMNTIQLGAAALDITGNLVSLGRSARAYRGGFNVNSWGRA